MNYSTNTESQKLQPNVTCFTAVEGFFCELRPRTRETNLFTALSQPYCVTTDRFCNHFPPLESPTIKGDRNALFTGGCSGFRC